MQLRPETVRYMGQLLLTRLLGCESREGLESLRVPVTAYVSAANNIENATERASKIFDDCPQEEAWKTSAQIMCLICEVMEVSPRTSTYRPRVSR